jgi:kynurenine/2-aminoadipate aminotransferase
MHGGLPADSSFPFESFTCKLKNGTTLEISDPAKVAAAQQYCVVQKGYPPLHSWAKQHMLAMHSPPSEHEVMVTGGSNQCIDMVCSLFLERGDCLLCEEYTYPHIMEGLMLPKGVKLLPVSMDKDGMKPDALRALLERLQSEGKPVPKLLYTVPTGQNPTGTVLPAARKEEVYYICKQFGILILEDDPYWYLQFGISGEVPGLALGTSYLSLDTDGRVIRLDSFSKFLSPGLRLGWVTAHPHLIDKLVNTLHGLTLGPCSMSQVLAAELLAAWGPGGLEAHVQRMQREYGHRAAVLHAAAQQHLTGLAEWAAPRAGMFLWMKLLTVAEAEDMFDELKSAKVVVVPGRIAHCQGPHLMFPCPYIRVSFASATDADLQTGIERLSTVLRDRQALVVETPAASSSE